MTYTGEIQMGGSLSATLISNPKAMSAPLSWKLRNALRWGFLWGWLGHQMARLLTFLFGIPTMIATLEITHHKADGTTVHYGIVSYRVVTTAFVNFIVDQLQTDTTEMGDFKYHDSGVGTTAEDAANTDMETTDGESRATGTQLEGATANIYKSVGTIAYTTSKAITEHGLFSQATGTTLMDRSLFSAINVVSGDSIQFTYQLTLTAGS